MDMANEYQVALAGLLDAMEKQSYGRFFRGDRDKALSVLQRHLDNMSRYIDCVYEQESLERHLAAQACAGLRVAMEDANGRRTAAHNAAMGSLRVVNRIFDGYGLDPFIEIEPSDTRSDIGEKIAAYVSIMFLGSDAPLSRTDAANLAHASGVMHAQRGDMLASWLRSKVDK